MRKHPKKQIADKKERGVRSVSSPVCYMNMFPEYFTGESETEKIIGLKNALIFHPLG